MIPLYDITVFKSPLFYKIKTVTLQHHETMLIISSEGEVKLIGNIKDATIALINYINQIQNNGCSSIIFNDLLEVDIDNTKLLFHGDNPSETVLKLIQEFNKAGQLRIFW